MVRVFPRTQARAYAGRTVRNTGRGADWEGNLLDDYSSSGRRWEQEERTRLRVLGHSLTLRASAEKLLAAPLNLVRIGCMMRDMDLAPGFAICFLLCCH